MTTTPNNEQLRAPGTKTRRHRSYGRALALLTASRLVQQGGSFVFGLLMRGVLGPTKTGVWNYVDAWRQQVASLSGGVHYAADREMPMLRAQGRNDQEDEMRWVTFTWIVLEAVVLAAGFGVYWLLARDGLSSDVELGLGLVPALSILTSLVGGYEGFLVNRKRFELRAWLNLALFFLDWSLLLWVLLGGLQALLWGLLVTWTLRLLVYVSVVRRMRLFSLRIAFRRRLLGTMLRFGVPISLWNIGYTLLQRVDALVIGGVLGSRQLGLYYLGPQVAASLSTIPNTLSVISYPELMETYGRHGMERLKEHIKQYHQAMLVVAPIAAALGVFSLRMIVETFLTDFQAGLAPMRLVVAAVVFTQASLLSLQILLASKSVGRLVLLTLIALAAQGAVLGVGAISGLTSLWVAWSSVAGQGMFAVAALLGSAATAGATRTEMLRFWGRLPLAWAAFFALALAVDSALPSSSSLVAAGCWLVVKLTLFAAAAGAILTLADRASFRAFAALMGQRQRPV